MKVNSNIKWLIAKSEIPSKEIAQELDMSAQQLSAWSNGRAYPRIDKAIHLLTILQRVMPELTLEDLYEWEGKKGKNEGKQ